MTAEVASVLCAAIAAGSAISVAAIEKKAKKAEKARDERDAADRKRTEARAERRARESRLSMDMMSAACELSVVTAVAMRDGHTNGTLQPALDKAQIAQNNYESFLKDEAARAVAKI